jgi:hypothetical protein
MASERTLCRYLDPTRHLARAAAALSVPATGAWCPEYPPEDPEEIELAAGEDVSEDALV